MQLVNLTPLKAERFCLVDSTGADTLVVVVKGTYAPGKKGELEPAAEQAPIVMSDEYYGEPGQSSIRLASDVSLAKGGTDVVLHGHAYAPAGGAASAEVSLAVGSLSKTVRVTGDRQWERRWGSLRVSAPQPFERIPLTYERAFGGTDETPDTGPECEPFNPVGTGFRGKKSALPPEGTRVPNVEDPARPMKGLNDRPPAVGFGFVAPNWHPRVTYAGTYDQAWQRDRMPLVPQDFDPRFYSAASPGLFAPGGLSGGERVEVVNAGPGAHWSFVLPRRGVEFVVDMPDDFKIVPMGMDTALIDADARRVVLTWKGELNVHAKLYDIGWVKTQFVRGSGE
jgi:hypothetical protein